jgi:uncharacterized membrane protein YgaE (UPF0421/DUF939 family)
MNSTSYMKAMKIMLINDEVDAVENAMEILSKIQLNGEIKLKECEEIPETINQLNELLTELQRKND